MMNQNLLELEECYDLRVDGLFKIGRSPLCHAILSDTHVSKVHCSLNIRCKDDSSSSVDSEFKVMITDHSSNGTWISTKGKTLKLEKEKSTLLKEGDLIFLTRFTRAKHEAFGYKYLSTPFPRVIKCICKKLADKAGAPKYEESNVQICDGKSMKTVERALKRDSLGRAVNQTGGKNICTSATFVRSTGSPDTRKYNENYFNVDERKFGTTSKADKTQSEVFKSCESGWQEHVYSGAGSGLSVTIDLSRKGLSKCTEGDDKNRSTMKRKYKAGEQYFRATKLKFKSQTEESPKPQPCYRDEKPSVKKLESHKEAATNYVTLDSVPGKDSCTTFTKEKYTSDNTSNMQMASNKIVGITHSSSPLLVMKESDDSNIFSLSESPSKLSKSAKDEEKCNSLLTESAGKSDKLEQSRGNFDISTSMCVDRTEYGKCVHCGKLIPSVTISLHETVCEGESQEAKSQDHVPLSSFPLEGCLLASHSNSDSHTTEKLTTSGVAEQAEGEAAAKKNIEAHRSSLGNSHDALGKSNEREISVAKCKSRKIEGLNLDETSDQKTLQISKSLRSASPCVLERCTTASEDMNTATGTCKLAKSEGTFVTEPVKQLPQLKESATDRETGSVSPHRNPPALEKEESKERCTFCSALFSLPDLILHVSTCSETSAVPCTDSSDSESEQEVCPYCGKSFDVLDLVEHAEHCKPTLATTISARDIRQNDCLSSFLMERGSLFDPVGRDESPMRDKELCPKCHGEFALLELVNHADKCTGEGPSVGLGLEVSRVGVNGHSDGSHSDRGLDIMVDKESLSEEESDSNYDTSKGEDGIRYGEGDHDSTSRSGSDSENSFSSSLSGKVSESKDEGENEGSFIDATHKGSVDVGDDATHGDHDNSDSDGETSIHKSPTKDDDHEHAGMETSEDDSDSDEFEFCPKCREPFHLSRLIEHASNCTSVFPAVKTSSESRCCSGRSEPSDLSTLTPTVFTNCTQCGKRLTVDLLAVHYSECGKLNATDGERKSREGCSKSEESHPESILEPFDCRDNLSSRVEVETERRESRPATSSETSFTSKKLPATTESEVSSLSDDSSEGDETTRISFKRTLSSLDSYQECEEQCMFCLKMFAVSALVEHVCACATRNQAAKDDLEQCCYCYQTFHVSKLITHAESCDQKTAFGQDNYQCMTQSQSASGELIERCMYCFKDFPVRKLILHSQKCDGDMSGPRERFQSFVPSVHDLSAISSDAILTDTQRAALQHVISRSAQDSKNVFSGLLARVQRLGYSENDLTRTLHWVRSAAPIIIHINLDRVLRFLVEDTHYRNQFETGTSGGSKDLAARRSWEDRIFNNSYRHSSPSERVKYGVLNIVGDPRGVGRCSSYGDSFLQLKKVRLRTTFASMDTSGAGVKLSCCEHYENVLFSYTNEEITAIMDVATGKVPFHRSDCISKYKEVQIHGPVSLSENVECIVVNSRHQADPRIESLLYRFVEQNKCNLIWMDPDDMAGAAPLRFGPSLAPSFLTAELGSISRSLSRGLIGRGRAVSKRVDR